MAKKAGSEKTGGRVAGTPNKSTETLREICKKHNVDPFEAMIIIASKQTDKLVQFALLEKLLPYLEAKRANVTHEIDPDKAVIRVIFEDYTKK